MYVCKSCYKTASYRAEPCGCGAFREPIDEATRVEIEMRVGEAHARRLWVWSLAMLVLALTVSFAVGAAASALYPEFFVHRDRSGILTPRATPFLELGFVVLFVLIVVVPKPKLPSDTLIDQLDYIDCRVSP